MTGGAGRPCTRRDMAPNGRRRLYTYLDPTPAGEVLEVEVTRIRDHGGAGSLAAMWRRQGLTDTVMTTWWHVQVCATDGHGRCRARYNPTEVTGDGRPRCDFAWLLEATEENLERILREVERRAYGGEKAR